MKNLRQMGESSAAECGMIVNCRIILNIVATYGLSLYALAIGLFCGCRMVMGSVV